MTRDDNRRIKESWHPLLLITQQLYINNSDKYAESQKENADSHYSAPVTIMPWLLKLIQDLIHPPMDVK